MPDVRRAFERFRAVVLVRVHAGEAARLELVGPSGDAACFRIDDAIHGAPPVGSKRG